MTRPDPTDDEVWAELEPRVLAFLTEAQKEHVDGWLRRYKQELLWLNPKIRAAIVAAARAER